MSQIVIGITDEQLQRIDALAAARKTTRESIALAGLERMLAESEPKPKPNRSAAVSKLTIGAQEEE